MWAERGGNTEHLHALHWGMFGRPGRDSGPPGIVETEVCVGRRTTEALLSGKRITFRVKAKKPGISFQLFLVVGLAFLQRLGDTEPLNLLRLPITLPPPSTSVPRPVFHHLVYMVVFIYFLLSYDWNIPEHL